MRTICNKNISVAPNFLKRYGIILFAISMIYGCASSAYKEAKETNTVEAYNEFLREYSGSKYAEDAIKLRLSAAYQAARVANSIAAYDEFLRIYQNNEYTLSVRQLREESAFTNAKEQDTLPAYEVYLREYPQGIFVSQANSLIEQIRFDEANRENTVIAYSRYLRLYPKGKFAAKARNNIETLAFDKVEKANDIASYSTYLRDYPDGKFAGIANERRDRLMFREAEEKNTLQSYRSYLREYPKGEFAAFATERVEQRAFADAQKQHTVNSYSTYLNEYPDGKFAVAAYKRKEALWFIRAKKEHSIDGYDGYLSEYPDGEFAAAAASGREQVLSTQAGRSFAMAKTKNTIDSYWQYISDYPEGARVSDALELLQSANREIIWNPSTELFYHFIFMTALSPKDENFKDKLKKYPLHYFIYLYAQAAEGIYMLYGYEPYYPRFIEPIPPILEVSTLATDAPNYPTKPQLTKGEFETSGAFAAREHAALIEWEKKKDVLENPARERDKIKFSAWQKRQDKYEEVMAQRNQRSQHPSQALLWQYHAVVTALLVSDLDFQLQYNADKQVFAYSVTASFLNMAWQGELPIGLDAAEQFKANISQYANRQLHFTLDQSGLLELTKITDTSTDTSVMTQNNSPGPIWLPNATNLSELPLHKLALDSNFTNTITWIDGITFGSTPVELLLPAGDYKIEVSKHPYAFFSEYDDTLNLQSDTFLDVDLELHSADQASLVQYQISRQITSNHRYYTKLDRHGNALGIDAPTWACVRDNKSGLVWEVKTNYAGIHNKDSKYRWGGKTISKIAYKANSYNSRLWGASKYLNGEGAVYGEWDKLIDASNNEQFCGYSDWRVPTLTELATLVRCYHEHEEVMYKGPRIGCVFKDDGRSVMYYDEDLQRPTINSDWFPNAQSARYWSANAEADSKDSAWCLEFDVGYDRNCNSSDYLNLRLVRSSR